MQQEEIEKYVAKLFPHVMGNELYNNIVNQERAIFIDGYNLRNEEVERLKGLIESMYDGNNWESFAKQHNL